MVNWLQATLLLIALSVTIQPTLADDLASRAEETGIVKDTLTVGYYHACALKQDHTAVCWGGGPTTSGQTTPPTNPVGGFVIANDGEHKQFSQEIKLTGEIGEGTRYVAGMYFFDEKNVTDFADLFSLSPTLTLVLEDRILNNRADAMAIYTQWDFTPFEKATLTVGGRYTDETKKVAFTANAAPGIAAAPTAATRVNTANLIAAGIPLELGTALFTPRIAFKYDVSDDMNVFASATRGFKSGGWNAPAPRRLQTNRLHLRRCGPTSSVCDPSGLIARCA